MNMRSISRLIQTYEKNLTIAKARRMQAALRARLIECPLPKRIASVGGADVAVAGTDLVGVIVVMRFPSLELIEVAHARRTMTFPYVPGYLAFREVPVLAEAWSRLTVKPDFVICDGHGRAHPKRFGSASHLGVCLDVPTVGCGKSLLVGEYREPGHKKGDRSELRHHGETIGSVLRSRDRTKVIFISPGHRSDFRSSLRMVMACVGRYRLPEPIRAAHHLASELKKVS